MRTLFVMLRSITDVKSFVDILTGYNFNIDLISGRYVVDGKSMMGIFSLDLSKQVEVRIYNDHCEELVKELEPFMIKE